MSTKRRYTKNKPTEYKYVREMILPDAKIGQKFCATIPKLKHYSVHDDIRLAAKMVDKVLIKNGKEPVNILKRK